MKIEFYYISGRGWVAIDIERCPRCGQKTGKTIERPATIAELKGLIYPAMKNDAGINKVSLEFPEDK